MLKITARHLGKKYGNNRLFKNLDLDFEQPGNYAITGFNGSGKSTLLLCLAGFITPTEGHVTWALPDRKNKINDLYKHFAFCSPALTLFEELSLLELMEFHAAFVPSFKKEKALAKLEQYGLQKAKNKPVAGFSSGMKQRLKLLLAFENDVPVLFLDEPCSNLDEPGVLLFQQEIQQINAQKLIIVATNQPVIEFPVPGKTINIEVFK